MKNTIAFILFLLFLDGIGQKKTRVTIIGTAHYFQEAYQPLQSFEEVKSFIVDLNPDAVCIEAIPIDDTLSLREIWPNTMKKADRLSKELPALKAEYTAQNLLEGAAYYASHDYWNAYYKWFSHLSTSDSLGYFQQFYRDQSKSEYGLMVFPVASKLGIHSFHGIDYRVGEKAFLNATNTVLKKLLISFKWKPLRSYLKTQKQYKKAEKDGELIEFINGDVFQTAFSNLINDLPEALPKSTEAGFVKSYWLKRNRIMSERLISIIQQQQPNNVLLTVGSAHVTHIKHYLEKAGISVDTYGQILKTKN